MITPESVGYAFLGGILPSLVWLYFLIKEDSRCPEPRTLILLAFLTGMIAVPFVLPLEHLAASALSSGLPLILSWAAIEEIMKFSLAALVILWRRQVDESVDVVVYMLTVALGFAALENTLFLIDPFSQGNVVTGLVTDNLRFVGSTLLHVLASSVIGFSLAFAFRKPWLVRVASACVGLILAIALHALFNFLIIEQSGAHTIQAFFVVWAGAIVFFALFEILKYFRYRRSTTNTC